MSRLAVAIATLGPTGRLPPRLATLVADLVALPLALAISTLGMIPQALLVLALVFAVPAALRAHRADPIASQRSIAVLPRVAGLCVALGWGFSPPWLAALAFALWCATGLVRFPPESWFCSWLPPDASAVADDLAAGSAILLACSQISSL